ncbi:MAG: hypothetical protein JO166_00820 [Deltaproteobacteria bacterium]|nr:hypothetical protein [Deltaproteobacteria bacterium]
MKEFEREVYSEFAEAHTDYTRVDTPAFDQARGSRLVRDFTRPMGVGTLRANRRKRNIAVERVSFISGGTATPMAKSIGTQRGQFMLAVMVALDDIKGSYSLKA